MIEVGQTIGNYRITAKLGEGGMGIVYLAEHPVIGKKVAMKAIHPELARNAEVVSRFMTEAKSVNQIGNDHIVDISDFGNTPDGEFYFIMEFLQGESLADRLKRERVLPPMRALAVATQVADALGASHSHGIVHRDLKPENIYLISRGHSKDFVKVLDFGLAKLTQGDDKVSHKTRTGSVMGTPYYMAPEQCEGRPNIDGRADVYSLGVILFEMLTGKVPFGGEGYGEIIVKHITMQPPSPRTINPALPESLESIVFRALAKNRDQRFQTMEDLGAAMTDPEGYLAGAPRIPTPDGGATTGAMPVARADQASGQVGYGSGLTTGDKTPGASATPMPSTFRSGMGEILDEAPAPRSSKGLWLGVAAAVVIGAGGAFFMFGRGGDRATPTATPAAAVQAVAPPTATATAPAAVKVSFSSSPAGARVVRSADGKELGVTPLAADIAYGESPVEFVFKKTGYEDVAMSVVPNLPAPLAATLKPAATAAPAATGDKAAVPAAKKKPPSSHRKHEAIDPDGVIQPNF